MTRTRLETSTDPRPPQGGCLKKELPTLYTTEDVAAVLAIDPRTARKWMRQYPGHIEPGRTLLRVDAGFWAWISEVSRG